MLIPIDEAVHFDVTTHHPSTGAATDADSGPTFDVFEEATDTPILDDAVRVPFVDAWLACKSTRARLPPHTENREMRSPTIDDVEEAADAVVALVEAATDPLRKRIAALEQRAIPAQAQTRSTEHLGGCACPLCRPAAAVTTKSTSVIVRTGRSYAGADPWRPGTHYRKGAYVIHPSGIVYFAKKDTSTQPGLDWSSWKKAKPVVKV